MRLTHFAVRRKITVFTVILICVIFGAYSYWTLPTEASPDITIPVIVVNTVYVGAPPQDMENLITRPIEKELQGLEDVKEIRSSSVEGGSSITVEFNPDIDIDKALQRVKDRVDLAKGELPLEAEDPIVLEINFSNIPIMLVNLAGDYGLVRLKEIGEDLADDIETIPGVLKVDLAGGLEREVQVDVDPDRLAAYELSIQDVVEAIQRENISLPGGSMELGPFNYSVRVPGELEKVEDIGTLLVRSEAARPVYIRDVASVRYGFEERASYARLNQRACVSLSVTKRSGENIIEISDRVKALVDQRRALLPAGTTLGVSNKKVVP
ncbi:MAG: hypothetical protein GKR89_34035 [Candidatus Latescibacteria bacterium]|nr:hypothetical protein [Candidatus Latescibacterota bacterium]